MYHNVSKADFISVISKTNEEVLAAVGGIETISSSDADFYLSEDKLSGFGIAAEGCTIGVFILQGSMQDLLDAAKKHGAEYGMVTNVKVLNNYLKYNTKIVEQHRDALGPGKHWTKITWK